MRLATVVSTSPLKVRRDGDTRDVSVKASGTSVAIDDRVLTVNVANLVYIVANLGGSTSTGPTAEQGFIATQESTTSTSYTDLATPGPSVTLTAPASGIVTVTVQARLEESAWASYEVGGVQTASDDVAANTEQLDLTTATAVSLVTGLTAGVSYTFTMKYRHGGTAASSFDNRRIVVEAI